MLRKKNKGITLVALVITIIILLILAGISISALTNTGIFQKAVDAKNVSENAEKEQGQTLGEYEKELNRYMPQELTDDKINKVLSKTENTFLKDTNGNIFTLPAGFKMVVNEDTNNAKTVDKGIVIEDATVDNEDNATATNGSQFVWVPVGNIKKDDGTVVEINLDRYKFDKNGIPTSQGENIIETYYSETESKGNTIAKNITDFKNSVETNGGYYIGRYEARTIAARNSENDELTQITEKGTDKIYNFVTQIQAAEQAQNMYNSDKYTSDLMNSYAWNTATVFFQNCGTNKTYSRQFSLNDTLSQTGTNTIEDQNKIDQQCNVFDMASNLREWITETSSFLDCPCVNRGGVYNDNSKRYMSSYGYHSIYDSKENTGFRPILYINV